MLLKLLSSIWDWDCQSKKNLARRGHAAQIGKFHLGLGFGIRVGILSEAVGQKNLERRGHIAQIGKFKGLGLIFGWGSYQRSCLAKEP